MLVQNRLDSEVEMEWIEEMQQIEAEMQASQRSELEVESEKGIDSMILQSEKAIEMQRKLLKEQEQWLIEKAHLPEAAEEILMQNTSFEDIEIKEDVPRETVANEIQNEKAIEINVEETTKSNEKVEEVLENGEELEEEENKEVQNSKQKMETEMKAVIIEEEKPGEEQQVVEWREKIETGKETQDSEEKLLQNWTITQQITKSPLLPEIRTTLMKASTEYSSDPNHEINENKINKNNLNLEIKYESESVMTPNVNDECFMTPDAVCLPLEVLTPREKLSVLEARFSLAESFAGEADILLSERIANRFDEVREDMLEMESKASDHLQRSIDSLLQVIEDKTYVLEDHILEERRDLILTPDGLAIDPSKNYWVERCCNFDLSFLWY